MIEIRNSGRTLHMLVVQEGRAAIGGRAELFAPGAIDWPDKGMSILPRHRAAPEARAIPERHPDGRITLATPVTPVLRKAFEVEQRRSASVEFVSRSERTTPAGVRELLDAFVPSVAMVQAPEYETHTEIRRRLGPVLRSTVPTGRAMDCRCPVGVGCNRIIFEPDSLEAGEALATAGRLDRAVGTARLTPGRRDLGVSVELLDVEAARDLVSLIGGGVPVFARPLLNLEDSETSEDRQAGGTLTVRKAVFDTVLVKAVAGGVEGMEPVKLSRSAEDRGGLVRVTPPGPLETILEPPRNPGGRVRLWL